MGSIGRAKRISGWDNPTVYRMKLMANTPDPAHYYKTKTKVEVLSERTQRLVDSRNSKQKLESSEKEFHVLRNFYSS